MDDEQSLPPDLEKVVSELSEQPPGKSQIAHLPNFKEEVILCHKNNGSFKPRKSKT